MFNLVKSYVLLNLNFENMKTFLTCKKNDLILLEKVTCQRNTIKIMYLMSSDNPKLVVKYELE